MNPTLESILENEVVSQDGDVVVRRGVDPDSGTRVLTVRPSSEHPPLAVLRRLEHEFSIRAELDSSWAATPIALSKEGRKAMLVLSDPGAEPLERYVGEPVEVGAFLDLAVGMARAVGRMHERGLVHKDLTPANVLVDRATSHVWLTGFGHASSAPREHQSPMSVDVITGTFAYMAPEQTGRMNRSIDARSDLYSLGVLFYELLCGSPPFAATEPLEWIYCHLARPPVPPADRVAAVPERLSALVLKLLAKTAEERYQTAAGVEWDLERFRDAWRATGSLPDVDLATEDVSPRLMIPERLYGREREHAALVAALGRAVRGDAPELVTVSGYSGIGKSALVHELMKEVTAERTLYLSGKYDQLKRDVPFAVLAQAFGAMVRQVLRGSEEQIAAWRTAILDVVGRNGRVLVDLIPELEWLVGPQPPVVELGPTEARNRFKEVFRRFVGASATADHPVVLFLDDLQWVDPASLGLLEQLATQQDARHLLVVGAYRENEVGPAHPLTLALESIRKTSAAVSEIVLGPLLAEDVLRLVADAIRTDVDTARPLAEIVFQKTGGNPFFATQFLMSLADERLLVYDQTARAWAWDADRVGDLAYTDNVVDLMVAKLQRLPAAALERLCQLACLGSSASLDALALVSGEPEARVAADLAEAVRAGFVSCSRDVYRFLHDRIQEACYSLIPAESLPARHLEIGRRLLAGLGAEGLDERIFDVVDHLNRGAGLIASDEERESLGRLNAAAGRRALASVAYAAACKYLECAVSLGGADAWGARREETLALHLELAECEALSSNLERADELFDLAYAHADGDLERTRVLRLRMRTYQSRRAKAALEVGLEAARLLGLSFPETDDEIVQAYEVERRAFRERLGERRVADLYDLPVATDPKAREVMGLLADLGICAYNVRPVLTSLIYCAGLNMALEWGNTEASCMTYISYGALLVNLGDMASAMEFADLGLRLNERFGDVRLRGTLLYVQGAHISVWVQPVASCMPILEASFLASREVGDQAFAGNAAAALHFVALEAGEPLAETARLARRFAAYCEECRNEVLTEWLRLDERFAATLMDETARATSFDGGGFSEARYLEVATAARFYTGLAHFHLLKLIAAVMEGRAADALAAADACATFEKAIRSGPLFATFQFYSCLTLLALHATAPDERRREIEATVAKKVGLFRFWAAHCRENHEHRLALVLAELARVEGRDQEAMRHYDEAIRSAAANGFVQNEGLASELAARFYLDRGLERIALAYLGDARYCYSRWGAAALVARLDRDYPQLAAGAHAGPDSATGTRLEHLDLMTVLKASQAVSSDILLDRLIETLMRISIEHAGADRGLLVLVDGGEPSIAAQATGDHDGVRVAVRHEAATPDELPESILNYTIRTRERVLIGSARDATAFSEDPYLRERAPKSVLCLPLLKQAALVGVLYLENHLVPGAFSADRTAVLELLASQAAISLENATLYADLQREQQAIRELNASLELRVAERTNELAAARDRADEASRAKSVFLANMSHELRTPLNAVIGFAQLLEADATISGRSRERLGIVQRSGEHLLGLINDVLSISKIEAGKLALVEKPFDLPAMLRSVQSIVEVRAEAKGLQVVFDVDPRLPAGVRGDDGKLRQVLVNLLGNAVKFTDRGTVTLRARALEAGAGARASRIRFEVEDTGQGIAEEEIGQLFEAFGQTESGRASREGTGLGLVISRQIVRLMGGDIAVRSRRGEGTTFGFEVDLTIEVAAPAAAAERRVVGLAPDQAPPKILVVDDTDENRLLLVGLLEPAGFEVREAATGQQALEAWEAWRPDLILMDLRMPVMDGRAAAVEIRRREVARGPWPVVRGEESSSSQPQSSSTDHGPRTTDHCKIIAVTASAFEHEREGILASGVDDFVTKPFRVATIFEKLGEHLGVRYRYAEAGTHDDAEAVLTPERIAALAPEQVRELYDAIGSGDVRAAVLAAEAVAEADEPLGRVLLAEIRAFRFDELTALFQLED
jgi:predicted ATPase/signal transduction histidine kinase/DNA-binding response OmpR family regulator